MDDQDAAYAFVGSTLAAPLATLSLVAYADSAPDGALPPYVVYGNSVGMDTDTNGDVRVMAQYPFTVRAVLAGNASAPAVKAAIDASLGRVRGVVQNGFLFNCKRTGGISALATLTGRHYRYAGGRYLVTVRTTT